MSIYFQTERKNTHPPVGSQQIVTFDVPIHLSESLDTSVTPATTSPDFLYHADGTIDIYRASTFVVVWNIATTTGHSTDGQSFELRKRDYTAEALNPLGGEVWVPVSSGTAAYKLSPAQGNTILLVTATEIITHGKATVALVNATNAALKLNIHPHTKAGLVIFGIGPVDTDITDLYNYVQDLYSFISYSDVHIYRAYDVPFYYRAGASTTPNPNPAVIIPLSDSPDTNFHYQIGVIWSGYTYNFWLISSEPARTSNFTLSSGRTYYLLRAEDFVTVNGDKPLTWYQGQATFGTLWIDSGNYVAMPVILDNTGIYVEMHNNITNIVNAKFTQTLILTPPVSPLPTPPVG